MSPSEQRRSHFRIVYPKDQRPTFLFSGQKFFILDVSEQGFRFDLGKISGLKNNDEVTGTITFLDGESFIVRGTVVRIQEACVSVKLINEGLPWRKMMDEQRRLHQKYEKFK